MSRRGENIRKRKDGRWEARLRKEDADGNVSYISIYGKTYKEVKIKKAGYVNLLTKNQKQSASCQKNLNDIFEKWIAYKKNFIKKSTYNKYYNLYSNYIFCFFQQIEISKITNDNLQNFIFYLMEKDSIKTNEKLSYNTIKETIFVVKSLMTFAQKNKYIEYYPLQIDLPKPNIKKNKF